MDNLLGICSLPNGLLVLVRGKPGDLRIEEYRPVEGRAGMWTKNAPLTKPSDDLAAMRFETIDDVATALERELTR